MRRLSILLIWLFTALLSSAQITQSGIVQEYNEAAKKTPLAGVEVKVRYAGSTVSDAKGNFTLSFPAGKAGQLVEYRSIDKPGYEIFNKEALAQWNLNPNKPFVIIMCRSDRFKKIRDNYLKVSSESYARKLRQEEAALAKLKSEGKLRDAEYQQQLFALREDYERQLDNLEVYIDRFARIDLSEISSAEQEIIALVQEGKIDEAIQRYDELNIEDTLIEGIAELNKVKAAISQLTDKEIAITESSDSLYAMAARQIENLMSDVSEESLTRVKAIYCQLADNDSCNIAWLWKTGDFLSSTDVADYPLALHYYDLALSCSLTKQDSEPTEVATSYCKVAAAHALAGNDTEALENYQNALIILENEYGSEHPDVLKIKNIISAFPGEAHESYNKQKNNSL